MKRWRQERRLTMEEAGAGVGAGVSRSMWYAWENGLKVPSFENMKHLFKMSGGEIRAAHFYDQPEQEALKLAG